jgi:hypothetical protein
MLWLPMMTAHRPGPSDGAQLPEHAGSVVTSVLGPFRHERVCRWSLPDEEAEEAL